MDYSKGLQFISDGWEQIPANWVSRWGGVAGGGVAMICHVCLYFIHLVEAPSSSSKARGIRLTVALLGLFCLQNSATISLFEDSSLHHIVAAAYYVTYGTYMVMEVVFTMRWDLGIVAVVSLASKVRGGSE